MNLVKAKVLFDGLKEMEINIGREDKKIIYGGLEKPSQGNAETIAEDVFVTPSFMTPIAI